MEPRPPTTRPGFAREADAAGHGLTAGQAWRRASVNRHFGKFVWMVDLDLAREATLRSVEETRAALARLDPTAERLEIPIDERHRVREPAPAAGRRQPAVRRW